MHTTLRSRPKLHPWSELGHTGAYSSMTRLDHSASFFGECMPSVPEALYEVHRKNTVSRELWLNHLWVCLLDYKCTTSCASVKLPMDMQSLVRREMAKAEHLHVWYQRGCGLSVLFLKKLCLSPGYFTYADWKRMKQVLLGKSTNSLQWEQDTNFLSSKQGDINYGTLFWFHLAMD